MACEYKIPLPAPGSNYPNETAGAPVLPPRFYSLKKSLFARVLAECTGNGNRIQRKGRDKESTLSSQSPARSVRGAGLTREPQLAPPLHSIYCRHHESSAVKPGARLASSKDYCMARHWNISHNKQRRSRVITFIANSAVLIRLAVCV